MDEFKKIASSNLESAHYDALTSVLTVRFKGGNQYKYDGVSPELYAEFEKTFSGANGVSAGKFFGQKIRNVFRATKIEDWT